MQSEAKSALAPVRRLQVDADKARGIIGSMVREHATPEVCEEVYVALRSAVWLLIASRDLDEDALREWFDLVKSCTVYRTITSISEKLDVLADLVYLSLRVSERGPSTFLTEEVLSAIREHAGTATAEQIQERTNISDAFLAQKLWNLTAFGLVIRKGQGERAQFSLP